jgi:putative sterol carrier protein
MACFKDAQDVYATIGALIESLSDEPELTRQFLAANTIVGFALRRPQARITIMLREGEPPHVDFGPSELEPELVLSMDADTAQRFLLGELNLTVALARGQIRADGPVAKVLRLVPLLRPVFERYREQLAQQGGADLAAV